MAEERDETTAEQLDDAGVVDKDPSVPESQEIHYQRGTDQPGQPDAPSAGEAEDGEGAAE